MNPFGDVALVGVPVTDVVSLLCTKLRQIQHTKRWSGDILVHTASHVYLYNLITSKSILLPGAGKIVDAIQLENRNICVAFFHSIVEYDLLGMRIKEFECHYIRSIAQAPDGNIVAARDEGVTVFDYSTARMIEETMYPTKITLVQLPNNVGLLTDTTFSLRGIEEYFQWAAPNTREVYSVDFGKHGMLHVVARDVKISRRGAWMLDYLNCSVYKYIDTLHTVKTLQNGEKVALILADGISIINTQDIISDEFYTKQTELPPASVTVKGSIDEVRPNVLGYKAEKRVELWNCMFFKVLLTRQMKQSN
jgi:hypothetical protein